LKIRVAIGVFISALFIYLAFHKVDFDQMVGALQSANYRWLAPAILVMLTSHWIRAVRWRAIMTPIKICHVHPLFSALMVGYAANNLLPLRLGEFLRAYAVGKSQTIPKTSAFATVIVERLLDLMALLLFLGVTVSLFPLPAEVKTPAYAVTVLTFALMIFVAFLMTKTDATMSLVQKLLPQKIFSVVDKVMRSFVEGFEVFRKSEHYLLVALTSVAIWLLYAGVVYLAFFAFDFQSRYGLGVYASLVVLVVISVGITIPSSPGYVGTYHWFCMLSLSLFGVPKSEALSFAIVSHAINVLPFTIIGLAYFWRENLSLSVAVAGEDAT